MGIGAVPSAPLEVVTGISVPSLGSSRYFNTGTGTTLLSSSNYTSTVSIVSNSSVWVKNGWSFIASSDQRIKTNIQQANIDDITSIFDNINLYQYSYIDAADIDPSTNIAHGFIAQEVNQYFPEAVEVHSQCVPSIYKMSTSALWTNADHSVLRITMPDPHNLVVGDSVQFFIKYSDIPITAIVQQVVTDKCFDVVLDPVDVSANPHIDIEDNVFVYGKMVDDFLALDKHKLLGLCYGAVKKMRAEMNDMKEQMSNIMARMDAS